MDKFSVEKPHVEICLFRASGNPGKLRAASVSSCDHTGGRASQICLPRTAQPVPAKIREALSSSVSLFEQDVSVGIHSSVHPYNHTSTHFHFFNSVSCVCYLPGTVRAFLELLFQWTMAFYIGNEIMEKVSHSRPCITFYPALAACQILF